jgi:hypothetical protein
LAGPVREGHKPVDVCAAILRIGSWRSRLTKYVGATATSRVESQRPYRLSNILRRRLMVFPSRFCILFALRSSELGIDLPPWRSLPDGAPTHDMELQCIPQQKVFRSQPPEAARSSRYVKTLLLDGRVAGYRTRSSSSDHQTRARRQVTRATSRPRHLDGRDGGDNSMLRHVLGIRICIRRSSIFAN